MSWWEWSQWQPDEWRQDDGWRQAWADTQFLGPLLFPDAPPERIAKATDDAAVAAEMEVPVARVTDEAAVVTDEVEPGTASANASGQQSSSAGPPAAPPPPGSAAPAPGIASAPATSGQPSSSARPSAASPPPGPATPAPGPASAPDFEEYIAQVCREYPDIYERAKADALNRNPFGGDAITAPAAPAADAFSGEQPAPSSASAAAGAPSAPDAEDVTNPWALTSRQPC